MSSIGWIDFSSEHRERVRTVIDLLSVPGVLDELGIGVVRDSFADRMFPGISTIQTRPKYFILTAILLRDYLANERHKPRPRPLERYLADWEKWCRIRLVENHGPDELPPGIIGGTFGTNSRRDVIRRPSSIYWTGLLLFGFVHPRHLSLAEFGRRIADERRQLRAVLQDAGKERGDDPDAEAHESRPRVTAPAVPDDFWDSLSIDLSREEAVFLREQVKAHQPDSLIGRIMMDDEVVNQVADFEPPKTRDDEKHRRFEAFADLPFIRDLRNEALRCTVRHARDFWTILEGAHIRYNCLVQAKLGTDERRQEFEERWARWQHRIADFPPGWDSEFMWRLVAARGSDPRPHTRDFINAWIEEAKRGAENVELCNKLVTKQESCNKKSRARLRPGNDEAVNGWVGLDHANYRLAQVQQFVRDIRDGECRKGGWDA